MTDTPMELTKAAVAALPFANWVKLDPERLKRYRAITNDEEGDREMLSMFESYGMDLSDMVYTIKVVWEDA